MGTELTADQQLTAGQQLDAANGKTKLIMQGDGNLVLYENDNGAALWSSGTNGRGVQRAIMQGDGNLVTYDANNHAWWATGTNGHPGAKATLQDDGNFVVYDSAGKALWASNTVHSWDPFTTDSGNSHVRTGNWMHSWASLSSTGLISGHTRTWCTIALRGFTGSAFPVLLDANGKGIWPSTPEQTKHRYGVDGAWLGLHDRTDYWTNQVDADVIAQAKSLAVVHYYDPRNRLMTDIPIILKTAAEIIAAIAVVV